jgi:hypothetical protein
MNVILTSLHNFQEYILTNIEQLLKLNHKNIYVVTNVRLFHHFDEYASRITLIDADSLDDSYQFESTSSLDNTFRDGFWRLTSLRLFYVYEFMKKYNVSDVIHIENDAPVYYNCECLLDYVDKNFMYVPFDTYTRNIASIIYIPNKEVYKTILDNYDFNKNDMTNFSEIKEKTGLIKKFPIFFQIENLSDEQNYVSENVESFPFIFDAAAIGQYLGGVDPRNIGGDTTGFVNETCVINYSNYRIWFDIVDSMKKPFIEVEGKNIPIFNLHIHSKALHKFV